MTNSKYKIYEKKVTYFSIIYNYSTSRSLAMNHLLSHVAHNIKTFAFTFISPTLGAAKQCTCPCPPVKESN